MAPQIGKVAVMWRGGRDVRVHETRNFERLRPIFDALSDVGVAAEPVLYCDETSATTRDRLLDDDGVLVWVDPIDGDEDRTRLDALLRDVSSHGPWVSAHPDTIEKMGTKEVLFRTKDLSWGTDTHIYATVSEFQNQFPARLGVGGPRVLKQNRGNGGVGVWKIALVADDAVEGRAPPTRRRLVRVQHAAPRDHVTEDLTLGAFLDRCAAYFHGNGKLVDQPYIAGVSEGMVRAYLVGGDVVGYASQRPAPPAGAERSSSRDSVLGLPSAKTMHADDDPIYDALRNQLENEWVPGLRALVALDETELPLIWDADFLPARSSGTGASTYVLCEINVSSVLPFPPQAPRALASAVRRRITGGG